MSLDEIKTRIKEVPISSIIGQFVNLKKKGAHHLAICPFHPDKHPSLTVNDQKGLFRCFACDVGGDSIAFVTKFLSLDFKEALLEIAKMFGISTDHLTAEGDPRYLLARKLLKVTAELYHRLALSQKFAPFDEFTKQRKLKKETVERFYLGYAPSNNALLYYLNSLPDPIEREKFLQLAVDIGLLRQGKKESVNQFGTYDTFRDRIIFPIWDSYHHVVGFGSRAVFSYQKAKYINSQESFIFNKRKVLYGHNFAKSAIRQSHQVIIVEGYMDLIALHQAGFENSVAVMGVALSDQSIQTLKSQTTNFYLGMDSDSAGAMAMGKMQQSLFKQGIVPKSINFSPHKDPDEFILAEGPTALNEKIKSARPLLEHQISDLLSNSAQASREEKLSKLQLIFEILSPLGNSLLATESAISASLKLGLQSGAEQIVENYKNYLSSQNSGRDGTSVVTPDGGELKTPQVLMPAANYSPPKENLTTNVNSIQNEKLSVGEKVLLRELLQHPEFLCEEQMLAALELLEQSEVKKLSYWLKDLYYEIDDSEYVSVVLDYLTKSNYSLSVYNLVGSALFHYDKDSTLDEKVKIKLIRDLHYQLKRDQLLKEREKLREKQKITKNDSEIFSVLNQLNHIEKEMNKIKLAK